MVRKVLRALVVWPTSRVQCTRRPGLGVIRRLLAPAHRVGPLSLCPVMSKLLLMWGQQSQEVVNVELLPGRLLIWPGAVGPRIQEPQPRGGCTAVAEAREGARGARSCGWRPRPLPASPTLRWHLLTWCLPQLFLCEEGAATLTALRTLVLDFPLETRGERRLSQGKQFLSQAPAKLCSRSPPQTILIL